MTKRNKPRSKPERGERARPPSAKSAKAKAQGGRQKSPERAHTASRGEPRRDHARPGQPRRDDSRRDNSRRDSSRSDQSRRDPARSDQSRHDPRRPSNEVQGNDRRRLRPYRRENGPQPSRNGASPRDAHSSANGASTRERLELPKLVDVPGAREVPHLEPHPPRTVLLSSSAEYDASDIDPASEEAPELGIGTRVVPPNVRFEPDSIPPSSESGPRLRSTADPAELEAQIRSLEARLDGLIRRAALASESAPPPSIGDAPVSTTAVEVAETSVVRPQEPALAPAQPAADGYVQRQWGRQALRNRLEEVDDFGLDPSFESKLLPALDLLYRRYFRVQVENIHHVPSTGRAVIVANHGGTLPLDGAMLRTAIRLDHPSRRDLRWLAEDFVFYLPFAGVFLNRIGAVRACPENAERLLEKDSLVAVFPEGVHGIKKLFRQRYQLQRFGRGGYIRLCLRMRAPLIPCAIIGAEETNPLLYRFDTLAELWKLPYLPVTPTFPLLGPLGLVPAPTRWKLRFGEPISFDHYGPEALDDDVLVGRLSERVRAAIQGLLDSGLSQRKSVWFG